VNAAARKELEGKSREERQAAMEKSAPTRKAQREEIAAVLTPEQKEKYEKLGARGPGGGGRRGGGDAPEGDKKPEEKK
jgi:Spy/CpxP family protein refolding chaperone